MTSYHRVGAQSKRWREPPIVLLTAFAVVLMLIVFSRKRLHHLILRYVSSQMPLISPLQRPPPAAALSGDEPCVWEPWASATVCLADREAESPNLDAHSASPEEACLTRAHTHICRSTSSRALLVGPLTSTPGLWHSIGVAYTGLLLAGDRVTAVTSDAVNATSGEPVPYPPLHIHHIHVARESSVHWHETHGDYQLTPDGYTRHMPPGYCESNGGVQATARFLTGQINDVRFTRDSAMSTGVPGQPPLLEHAKRASHALPFYVRLVFRVAPKAQPCRPVTKFIWWYPFTTEATKDLLTRYNVGTRDAVWWWAFEVPRRLRILPPAWLHSHRARYGGLLLLRGNHSPHGLLSLHRPLPSTKSVGCTPSSVVSAAGARACLYGAALSRNELVCADDEAHQPSSVQLPASADGATGGLYDRQGAVRCEPLQLGRAERLSLFAFSTVRWNGQVDPFPQHTMLFFFADTNASATELVEVLPPRYGVWEFGSGGSYRANLPLARDTQPKHSHVKGGSYRSYGYLKVSGGEGPGAE